jgi:uncharacterized SAM-binding protein YcdF (DUF218 family)
VITLLAIISSLGSYEGVAFVTILFLVLITLLIVPVFLIHNGLVMIKREGRSLANLLSLVFGILIGLGEIATFAGILMMGGLVDWNADAPRLIFRFLSMVFSMVFSVSVIYVSISFVIFMVYCVFLQIIPRKRDFDYVIIHGAGLIDGYKMSKLLSQRVDKAIEVYQKDPTPPILIPSGGKGNDEKISEAEAMEKYLLDKGIPQEKIIKEDKSRTTMENLINSKKIIDEREGRKYTALVTSNYHVYRALRYCRKIGLKCVGIGSPVAWYYWPSALIREYIAVHSEKKRFIILVLGWILWMIPLVLAFISGSKG